MVEKTFLADNADQAMMIFGAYDANISLIEDRFGVRIFNREGVVVISGEEGGVSRAQATLAYLKKLAALGEDVTLQKTEYVMNMVADGHRTDKADRYSGGSITSIEGRGAGETEYHKGLAIVWRKQVKSDYNAQYKSLYIIPQDGKVWYKMMIIGAI